VLPPGGLAVSDAGQKDGYTLASAASVACRAIAQRWADASVPGPALRAALVTFVASLTRLFRQCGPCRMHDIRQFLQILDFKGFFRWHGFS
jgi:hypothetical protein